MSGALQPLGAGFGERIEALERNANAALQLAQRVRAALPEPEKNHVLSAGYRDGELVITVDSPAWAAHVRYRENALRHSLTGAGETPFTKLKVRVGQP